MNISSDHNLRNLDPIIIGRREAPPSFKNKKTNTKVKTPKKSEAVEVLAKKLHLTPKAENITKQPIHAGDTKSLTSIISRVLEVVKNFFVKNKNNEKGKEHIATTQVKITQLRGLA